MNLVPAILDNTDELVAMNNQLVIDEQFDVILPQSEMISRMKEFITGDTYDCYMIVKDDIHCGYALLDKTKDPIYLRHLFVKSEYRRQGLGEETINQLLAMYNSESLDIEVMSWNGKALEFYKKLGFTCRYHGMRISKS